MGTGAEKLTRCQPDAVSPVKVALAIRVPVEDQMCPTWTPVFVVAL
jgi:hypothetical protein